MKRIPYAKALITNKDVNAVKRATKLGWGNNHYSYVSKFEKIFSKKIGSKYSLATSSCTGAITIALLSLGIKKNDEIILSDTNWIAPAAVIKNLGAKCVFIDINPKNWCIDTDLIEKKINKKTKLIIATHLYGNVCDMKKIQSLKKKYNIPILEDAAEALGSKYKKKYVGSIGDMGVFSFHGTKTITTGEGGMLVTNNKKIYKKALLLSNHGRPFNKMKDFIPIISGVKFKMTNMQAALGISQFSRFDKIIKRKIQIFKNYKKYLNLSFLKTNINENGNVNSYWMPTIIFDKSLKLNKKFVLKKLEKYNIDARPFFVPLSSLAFFKKQKNKNSYDFCQRGINLPSYLDIKRSEIINVTKIINEITKKNEKRFLVK